MEFYMLTAQSITQAQHMQRALEQVGLRSQIMRAHRTISRGGCGYALRILCGDLTAALLVLRRASVEPERVYLYQNGTYQEVAL